MLIKPSKKSIEKIKKSIKDLFKQARHYSADFLILKLNPILRGWSNYHNCVVASKTFKDLDRYQWKKLWNWAKKKTGKKGKKFGRKAVRDKYFKVVGGRKWVFHAKTESGMEVELFHLKGVPIRRHKLVLNLNPFEDENKPYFLKRKQSSSQLAVHWTWKQKKVLKNTGAICLVCNQLIGYEDQAEMHHVTPKKLGGADSIKNLIMLHKQCHAQVTHTKDPGLIAQFEKQGILKLQPKDSVFGNDCYFSEYTSI